MIFYKILFFSYLILLLYWGSRRTPGFASWHMFANLNMMHFFLYFKSHASSEDVWEKLEPFNYLPHTHLSMSKSELKWFLVYLGKIKKLEVKGSCLYFFENNEVKLFIERNRIIND